MDEGPEAWEPAMAGGSRWGQGFPQSGDQAIFYGFKFFQIIRKPQEGKDVTKSKQLFVRVGLSFPHKVKNKWLRRMVSLLMVFTFQAT